MKFKYFAYIGKQPSFEGAKIQANYLQVIETDVPISANEVISIGDKYYIVMMVLHSNTSSSIVLFEGQMNYQFNPKPGLSKSTEPAEPLKILSNES